MLIHTTAKNREKLQKTANNHCTRFFRKNAGFSEHCLFNTIVKSIENC